MAFSNGKPDSKPSPLLSRTSLGCYQTEKNNDSANGEQTNPVGKIKYRKIPSLKFLYEISEDGEVRNVKSKKVLKPFNQKGYLRMEFGHRGPKKYIHQLVMEVWGPPKPSEKHEIDHIDGNPLNNHISNLQWVTHKENMAKRGFYLTGQERPVMIEDTLTGEITYHVSVNGAGRALGSTGAGIYRALNKGYLFRKRYRITYIDKTCRDYPERE